MVSILQRVDATILRALGVIMQMKKISFLFLVFISFCGSGVSQSKGSPIPDDLLRLIETESDLSCIRDLASSGVREFASDFHIKRANLDGKSLDSFIISNDSTCYGHSPVYWI